MINNHRLQEEYCRKVLARLSSSGFKVTDNVPYRSQPFAHVAQRMAFEVETLSFTETFFMLAEFNAIDVEGLRTYCNTAYNFALSRCRLPKWVPFHGTLCYCVVLTYGADKALAQAVRSGEPPKHFSGFEIPVVVDLAARQVHCTERTAEFPEMVGLHWQYFRATVASMLSLADQEEQS